MMGASGGIYRFRCSAGCGNPPFEQFTWDSDLGKQHCPSCDAQASLVTDSEKHPGLEYDRPLMLRSIGVSPEQIPEAKKRFPHHEFAPDGRMIVRSHQEYKRVLKDLGYMEM